MAEVEVRVKKLKNGKGVGKNELKKDDREGGRISDRLSLKIM